MKALAVVLGVLVAAHAHITVVVARCPLSVPVAWYAAVTVGVPLAVLAVLGRRALARNRWPRLCWYTAVTP